MFEYRFYKFYKFNFGNFFKLIFTAHLDVGPYDTIGHEKFYLLMQGRPLPKRVGREKISPPPPPISKK